MSIREEFDTSILNTHINSREEQCRENIYNDNVYVPEQTSVNVAKKVTAGCHTKPVNDDVVRIQSTYLQDDCCDDCGVQPDWNQNDSTAEDYIENKPSTATNDDSMDFLAEMGMITPVTNSTGEILISPSNEIYSL